MKINNLIISILIFLMSSVIAHAQSDKYIEMAEIDNIKSKLATHAASTVSIESTFIQEKHLWMLDEVLISKGEFLFKKENSVRWQYNTPIQYTIVIHNGLFTIVNNNKISEFNIDSNPMFREINSMIVTAIRGDFIDNKDFEAKFFENTENYLAKLVPINNQVSSMLETIEIYFDKQNMQVVKIVFSEPGDDFTLITFQNKKINSNLDDDRFMVEIK